MLTILLLTVALGLLDVALTAWGLSLGMIEEANPIISNLLAVSPVLGYGVTVGMSLLAAWVLWGLRDRSPIVRPALYGVLGVRVVIIGMHFAWMAYL